MSLSWFISIMKKISCPESNCIGLTCKVQIFMCFIFKLFFKSLYPCSNRKIKINSGARLLMLMPYLDGCRIGSFSSSRDIYWKDLVVFFKCIYSNDTMPGSGLQYFVYFNYPSLYSAHGYCIHFIKAQKTRSNCEVIWAEI